MSAELQRLERLYGEVRALQDRGRDEEALEIALGLVEPARRHLGKDGDGLAEVLTTVGILSRRTGRLAQAEPAYLEALDIRRRAPAGDPMGVAATESSLGVLYLGQDRAAEAEPLLRSSLVIRRRVFGDHDPQLVITMRNLAGAYAALDRLDDAESLLAGALAILEASGGDPSAIDVMRSLAELNERLGRTDRVVALRERILDAGRQVLPQDHPSTTEDTRDLADAYLAAGRYADAEPLYRGLLARMADPAGAEATLAYAACLTCLALLHRQAGRLDQAEREYADALDLVRRSVRPDAAELAGALNNLAAIHREQGRYDAAIPAFEQAIAIQRGGRHAGLAASLNNLALLHAECGELDTAEALYEEALQEARREGGDADPRIATAYNNLAELHRETGRLTEAERLQRAANDRYGETLGDLLPSRSRGLLNLALTEGATSRYGEALTSILRAATIDDRTLAQVLPLGSLEERAANVASSMVPLHAGLTLAAERLADVRWAVQGTFDLLLRRKGLGAEAALTQREAILSGRHPQLVPRLAELTELRARQSREAFAGGETSAAEREALEAELAAALTGALEDLWSVGRRDVAERLPPGSVLIECVRFPAWDAGAPGPMTWRATRFAAFTLPANRPDDVALVDLGEAGAIDDLITAFRAAVGGGDGTFARDVAPDGVGDGAGRALGSLLGAKLLPLVGSATRLLIAPDGDLARLPFEALPLSGDEHWIDAFEISYVTTGRDVLRFGVPAGAPAPALVLADPDFDLSAPGPTPDRPADPPSAEAIEHLYFPPLPESRAEGERIAALLGVEPLLGACAVKGTVKACGSPRILHIATHGYFLPNAVQASDDGTIGLDVEAGDVSAVWTGSAGDVPFGGSMRVSPGRLGRVGLEDALLRSGLALAGANTWLEHRALPAEAEDGFLTAENVAALDLLATELVVLSACETGLGEVRVGEGVFGLRRACVLAGARTLVMSLWKVPDDTTRPLMEDFYRRVLAGEPRSAALRQAQLAVKAVDTDPLAWGGFICQGDPGELASQHAEYGPAEQGDRDHLGGDGRE